MFSSEIDLSGTDLTSVHPKLLANVVCQLRQARSSSSTTILFFFNLTKKSINQTGTLKVSLAGSLLTLQQSETLFATLAKLVRSSYHFP